MYQKTTWVLFSSCRGGKERLTSHLFQDEHGTHCQNDPRQSLGSMWENAVPGLEEERDWLLKKKANKVRNSY